MNGLGLLITGALMSLFYYLGYRQATKETTEKYNKRMRDLERTTAARQRFYY